MAAAAGRQASFTAHELKYEQVDPDIPGVNWPCAQSSETYFELIGYRRN